MEVLILLDVLDWLCSFSAFGFLLGSLFFGLRVRRDNLGELKDITTLLLELLSKRHELVMTVFLKLHERRAVIGFAPVPSALRGHLSIDKLLLIVPLVKLFIRRSIEVSLNLLTFGLLDSAPVALSINITLMVILQSDAENVIAAVDLIKEHIGVVVNVLSEALSERLLVLIGE